MTRSYCLGLRHELAADSFLARLEKEDRAAVEFHLETFESKFTAQEWEGCVRAYEHIQSVKQDVLSRPVKDQMEMFV